VRTLRCYGQGGIRTRETLSRPHAFQACALSHSATCPDLPKYDFPYGQGGIRTLDTVAGMPVFETGSFNHSDTCPNALQRSTEI
jgi:hypothetical protein